MAQSLGKREAAVLQESASAWSHGRKAKKAKFDARNPSRLAQTDSDDGEEGEDAILRLGEIGRGGQQVKRNAVRLDGYDSDSSTENFNTRAKAKARGRKEATVVDDMFADLEDSEDSDKAAKENGEPGKAKEVRFLDEDEIEGQIKSSKSGGHITTKPSTASNAASNAAIDYSSASDEEVDNEERARVDEGMDEELGAGSKKRHAPKLDAFNMRDESKEGRFDENGNFVRNAADPYAVYDSWLEGSSKIDMKRAKDAQMKREQTRRENYLAEDAIGSKSILAALLARLQKSETILEALGRLNHNALKKKKLSWRRNKIKSTGASSGDVEMTDEATTAADDLRKKDIEAITASADWLLTRGQSDVYELPREALLRQYRRETGEDWVDSALSDTSSEEQATWEFQWTDDRDGGEIHGPYDRNTMIAWGASGFFSNNVRFRDSQQREWGSQQLFDSHE